MSTILQHPFTCVISGPTSCGKTQLTIKLVENAHVMIHPSPRNVVWCYGIYQKIFDNLPKVRFQEGLPDVNDFQASDGPTLLIIDDLMAETNGNTTSIFTRGSHHKDISVVYLSQNLYYGSKHNRTISLNTHYLMLFKNPRDATQIETLARQMFPSNAKYLTQSFRDATSRAYGYLFIDLKPDTDDNMRLKTDIFPDDHPNHYVYVPRK